MTLAKILHVRGIPSQVLEADASAESRTQGGMLDIHEDSGQLALEAAGLREEFRKHVMKDGDDFRIMDPDGRRVFEAKGNGLRPEIERGPLRRILLDSLPKRIVRWGCGVASVSPADRGFELTMKDGSREFSDAVVGADGAWSRVRPLLTDAMPSYTGVTFVEMHYHDVVRRRLVASEIMGNGTLMGLGNGQAFLGHREPGDRLTFYAALRVPEEWGHGPVDREALHSAFAAWGEPYHRAIDESDSLEVRRIHMLPVGLTWPSRPNVTLVGDAAHLMSPFAGEGVNQALTDGHELAEAIAAHPGDLPEAIRTYEEKMFARTRVWAEESHANIDRLLGPEALQDMVAFFQNTDSTDL